MKSQNFFAISLLSLLLGSPALADPPSAEKKKTPAKVIKLFDGKKLDGWRIVKKYDFEDHGKIEVKNGVIESE